MSQLAWTCDLLGNVTWYNKRWLDYTGLAFEDMKGWGWRQVQHPDHVDRVVARVKHSAETGEPWEDTFPLRGKDGQYRWFLSRALPIRDEQGNLVQWFGTNTDVTAQREAEDKLRRGQQSLQDSERRFRQMIDALPAAIYTTDAQGRITHFNQAAVAFSGRVPELGTDEWCVTWKLYHPDGTPMPHDECPMAVALKEGREIRGAEAIAERPDGTRVWFTPYPTLLRDSEGRVVGAINMLVDITDRKRTDEANARLAAIVESSDDAIVSKDLTGIIKTWNAGAQRLFGYTADEAIGQPVTMLMPPDRVDEEPDILARIARGETINHYETVRRRKDGSLVDISLTVSPISDERGRVVGASKIARDISERKQAENTRQMLLNELNHRVKNTLASVQAIAQQTLARTPDSAEFVASFGGRIQSLARVHSMLSSTTWQGADLRDLVRDQVLQGPVDETKLTAWGPAVRLDPQTALHLALMLHELGTNSCKYGALSVPGGWVTVNWMTDDALHIRWVERGGPPVTTPSRRGFGVTLIEQSAKGQGGDAQMVCEAEGIAWTINLPLHDHPDSGIMPQLVPSVPPETHVAGGVARTSLAGRRFLVVEDEPLIGLDIVAGLEDAQAQVEGPIGTVKEAIEIIERSALDGALLDANLRGRPVDDIAAALTRRNVPFVFVTGHGPEGLPQAFQGVPILGKPCSRRQVLDAAAQLVTKRSDVVRLRR
jgi:PAS domain S-box-containing protein